MEESEVKIKGATLEDIRANLDKLDMLAYEGKKLFYKKGDKYFSPFDLKRDRSLFTEISEEDYNSYVESVNGVYPGEFGQLVAGDCVCDVEFDNTGEVRRYWRFEPREHEADEVFVNACEVYSSVKEFKEKYYGISE